MLAPTHPHPALTGGVLPLWPLSSTLPGMAQTPDILRRILTPPTTKVAEILKRAATRRQSALDDDRVLTRLTETRKRKP